MSANLKSRLISYLEPLQIVQLAIWTYWVSVKEAFSIGRYSSMINTKQMADAATYLFFQTMNDRFFGFEETMTAIPKLVHLAEGNILELGPGMGNQLCRFDKSKIGHITGVECNPHFAVEIQQQIKKQGFEGKYNLVISGVEQSDVLFQHGITEGSLDTVLSIQVLCSVPDAGAVVKEMYKLLKPGGQFIFLEHHRNQDWLTAMMQRVWNPLWKRCLGGCNITRDLKADIIAAGEWENMESLGHDGTAWSMMPRAWGVLVKPKNA